MMFAVIAILSFGFIDCSPVSIIETETPVYEDLLELNKNITSFSRYASVDFIALTEHFNNSENYQLKGKYYGNSVENPLNFECELRPPVFSIGPKISKDGILLYQIVEDENADNKTLNLRVFNFSSCKTVADLQIADVSVMNTFDNPFYDNFLVRPFVDRFQVIYRDDHRAMNILRLEYDYNGKQLVETPEPISYRSGSALVNVVPVSNSSSMDYYLLLADENDYQIEKVERTSDRYQWESAAEPPVFALLDETDSIHSTANNEFANCGLVKSKPGKLEKWMCVKYDGKLKEIFRIPRVEKALDVKEPSTVTILGVLNVDDGLVVVVSACKTNREMPSFVLVVKFDAEGRLVSMSQKVPLAQYKECASKNSKHVVGSIMQKTTELFVLTLNYVAGDENDDPVGMKYAKYELKLTGNDIL